MLVRPTSLIHMALYSVVCGAEQTYQSRWGIWISGAGHWPGLMQAEIHFSVSESYSSLVMECFLPCLSGCLVSIEHVRSQHFNSQTNCTRAHLKMPATETGETLGRTIFRTQPKSLKNPQQPILFLVV